MQNKHHPATGHRVLADIDRRYDPQEIFQLITNKECTYSYDNQYANACRDRAMMATTYASLGRISEVVGGLRIRSWYVKSDGTTARDSKEAARDEHGKAIRDRKIIGHHEGLLIENLKMNDNYILISGMKISKRSDNLIKKHGDHVQRRVDFILPLKCDFMKEKAFDQIIPFTWLLKEYLELYAPKTGKLFPYESGRAYKIIREITGFWPHWFRAQSEHFYGNFLFERNPAKLADYVGVIQESQVRDYTDISWKSMVKDLQQVLDFSWIEPAITKIRSRIEINQFALENEKSKVGRPPKKEELESDMKPLAKQEGLDYA